MGALAGAALALAGWLGLRRARCRPLPDGTPPRSRAEVALFAALVLGGVGGAAWHLLSGASSPRAAALTGALALAGPALLRVSAGRPRRAAAPRIYAGIDGFRPYALLKQDLFGRIELGELAAGGDTRRVVRRDFRAGAVWLRPVAAVLARREARALRWLEDVERVPRLVGRGRGRFLRSYVDGRPLAEAAPRDPAYFADGRRLLRRIHARGVTHNDSHKVHNWLVTPEGRAALVDFQIAGRHAARTPWFRLCALEDVRHLLKHKRRFCPEALTARERSLLGRRSWVARGWLATGKPVYVFVTRRLLDWRDREGRGRAPGPR